MSLHEWTVDSVSDSVVVGTIYKARYLIFFLSIILTTTNTDTKYYRTSFFSLLVVRSIILPGSQDSNDVEADSSLERNKESVALF
jgi:hypothetical protein